MKKSFLNQVLKPPLKTKGLEDYDLKQSFKFTDQEIEETFKILDMNKNK